ncbi:proprotein convertase subtilisin/kexin type 7 [Scleropages formosus]|uniref:Proprotein convertase subtilisin/kexin type 7 n=1 Tax=Scleropages formosus TaxID=113540 RepID=A0A8C9RZK5_SCLFO|nr:proprotein convertase subtilisin/kexin type 7 [Scleropages formosus]XP_018595928.1 proprotein convertase subtilisin/kexin type 7 [Scleropages formosus]XP_018595930.1 proprotein convertase subtilisin/kexin type 7 [Scleropages formosus]
MAFPPSLFVSQPPSLLLLMAVLTTCCWADPEGSPCLPGRSWAVRLHSGTEDRRTLDMLAHSVAQEAGLHSQGQIGQLEGYYLFCDVPEGKAEGVASAARVLATHPSVAWHSQEQLLRRAKRSMAFNDPHYPKQWHLHNEVTAGMDINVTGVWEHNITGLGVTVVVVDDGVQHTLQDIQPNYSPEGSYDLNSNDPDPMPHPDARSDNHHGTRCAGEIAAVPNNSFCAVGVAYGSRVAGIRVLDGPLTDSMEAVAFNKHYQVNDVYSCSWGPDDDGRTVDGPHPLGKAALQHGVIAGRRGFGSIFVVASGNGGQYEDDCNYDGYANSIYTVTIGAVDETGKMPFYAEKCASMLAVTFSSGDRQLRSIVTSDWSLQHGTGCTEGHTGTSAAAPLAAGMVALMLQVRPCLTWRDVQNIIVYTAKKYEDKDAEWKTNGAGFSHSHQHGFGLLNAWRLVNAAKVWESVPFLVSYQSPVLKEGKPILIAPSDLSLTWNVTASELQHSGMQTLEHVAVTVTMTHPRRGSVEIVLVCPSGMSSVIGARRSMDVDRSGYTDWTFSTVRCWGERAEGQYSLRLTDYRQGALSLGILKQWKLTLYGSSLTFEEVKERQRIVEDSMGGQYLNSSYSLPCPPGLDIPPEVFSPLTSNILKYLLFLGCVAFFGSLYYILEVVMAQLELSRLCRYRQMGRGSLEDGAELQMHPVADLEDQVPLITTDRPT